MGEFEVVAPCVYLEDNKATVLNRVGVFIELDDEIAATLPGALRPVNREEQPEPVEVEPVVPEPAAEGDTGTVLEGDVTVEPVEQPLDGPDATAPKPRRGRQGSDGQD